MFWLSRRYGNLWVEGLIFLLPVGFAFFTYVLVLNHVDGIALDHRDNLIAELGR
jgi:hypothetical protein